METEEALTGRRLADRYHLEERIAEGGMATVWRGRDAILQREVAVKVLRRGLAENPDILERFRLEAVAAARLSHPAIVRVFDTGVEDGVCYIVMELFEGGTAADVLADRGPLAPTEAVAILRPVLHGLSHAHGIGVIHRDVKPGNILVAPGGHVKVTDFGIAKAAFAGDDVTTTGSLLGTARYLAPEQVTGGDVDPRTDVYAAGIVLYELLVGRPPFEAETHLATATMRLTEEPRAPRVLRPGIPRAVDDAVMRALRPEPEDRFQSAEDMASALERVAPGPAASPPPPPGVRPRRPSVLRSRMLLPLVLLVVAALAVGSVVLWRQLGSNGAGTEGPADADAGRPVPIEDVAVHDPPPGDGREGDSLLPALLDGDPGNEWHTDGYNSADLGNLKPGVGVVFELAEPARIGEIRLWTSLPGWSFELHASDRPDEFPLDDPLGSPDGGTTFTAEEETRVRLEPVRSRFFMVWITELAESSDRYRAAIGDVRFLTAGD